MLDKFGRSYLLQIQKLNVAASGTITPAELITVTLPFTVEFNVSRSLFSGSNTASIRIYNLGKNTRGLIRQDQFDFGVRHQVLLQAGYGNTLNVILNGIVTQAWSVREGTNFITTIEATEVGFASTNAIFNQQYPAGTPKAQIIREMVTSLSGFGIMPGHIGTITGTIPKGNSFVGNPIDLIQQETGGRLYIDNGKANVLSDTESLPNPTFNVSSATGLLGTPVRENLTFHFEMLFTPQLLVGQMVHIDSSTGGEEFNRNARINGLHHEGTISEAICGDAITRVQCLTGEFSGAV